MPWHSGLVGQGRIVLVWVLRAHPFTGNLGSNVYLTSLIDSAARAGCDNTILLPSRTGLPLVVREGSSAAVRSRHLWEAGPGVRLARPAAAALSLAWSGYGRSPRPLSLRVARVRRRWRRSARMDHILGRDWTPQELGWLRRAYEEIRPDVVVFETPFTVTEVPQGTRRILLAHDVVHQRAASFASLGYVTAPGGVDRQWELERIADLDGIVTIQWDDAETFAAMVPDQRIVVAPPAFARTPRPPGGREPGTCLFVGGGSLQNVDGLNWLLGEVWGLVRERLPQVRLRVVGSVCSQIASEIPGVELVGEVEDLTPEYQRASVVVVPLRAGSGLKVKLAEAMSHASATVTTSVGAQGLSSLVPRPYLLADTAAQFAEAVVSLICDERLRSRVEANAWEAAKAFEPERAHSDLIGLLHDSQEPSSRQIVEILA